MKVLICILVQYSSQNQVLLRISPFNTPWSPSFRQPLEYEAVQLQRVGENVVLGKRMCTGKYGYNNARPKVRAYQATTGANSVAAAAESVDEFLVGSIDSLPTVERGQ